MICGAALSESTPPMLINRLDVPAKIVSAPPAMVPAGRLALLGTRLALTADWLICRETLPPASRVCRRDNSGVLPLDAPGMVTADNAMGRVSTSRTGSGGRRRIADRRIAHNVALQRRVNA